MSPLHEKLDQVEWGEWRLGDLFEVWTVKGLDEWKFKLEEQKKPDLIEFVWRTRSDNGVKWYIQKLEIEPNQEHVISVSQIGNVVAQIRKEKWYGSQNIFALTPPKNQEKILSFFVVSAINKALSWSFSDGYSNYPTLDTLKKLKINLPTKNGEIDFAFMETFVAELEAERMAELDVYLEATGLKDCVLTSEEERVLEEFERWVFAWKDFRIEDVLQWQSQKEIDPLKLENLKDETENMYPFYGQATINNGIISYNQLTRKALNNEHGKPTILIHSNNQNTVYLETPFYLKDGHWATSVLQSDFLNKMTAQFLMSSIKKVIFFKYSYNAKATKIELKNTIISLPMLNNQPDYDLMQTLISAMQKVVIRDVVRFVEGKMEGAASLVEATYS